MKDTSKIKKDNIEDIMELTDTQRGMLYYYIKDSDTKEYQEQTCITITGEIDIEILKKAWNYIIETNEMLRTIYKWDKLDKPVQIVLKNYEIPFKFFDLSKESNEVKDELFKEILENHKNENVNITNESIKITICKIEEDKCKMIMKNHHILFDGWSNGIILREFIEAYNCYFQGEEPIKQVKNKFKQLVKWNKQQDKNRQKEYWQKYLKDFEYESNIFNSNNTSKMHKCIDEYIYVISDLTKQKLEASAKKLQVSVAAILYSVWSILQQRYESSQDIILGMTVSGRTAKIKGIDNIVGMFINTIPLRIKTNSNQEASTLIKNVEESLRAHEEFESTSILDIKSYGNYNHEKSLFDNIVVIENYPLDKVADKNSKIKIEDCFISETTNYNLTFGISIFDDLEIKASYDKESFEAEFIIRMTKHYENILNEIVSNTSINISEIEMISEEEKNMLLSGFNDTYADYPRDKTIHELFEEQAQKAPDTIAVVFEDKKLTYRELNDKANKLARTLREKGVKPESIIGIMVERSVEMIVGIIGVLKAGGAYLPIDSEYPEDRIEYMLQHSKTSILLTQSKFIGKLSFPEELINLEDEKSYANCSSNLENISTSKDLAYVIYTSGSTGKPKGVMVEHKSVVNLCNWCNKKYNIVTNKNALQITNISFDVSVEETIGMLLNGGTIYIPHKDIIFDKSKFKKYVDENKINLVQFVPATLNELIAENDFMESLSVIICGGDRLDNTLKDKVISRGYNLYNNYGPTEITVDAISTKCSERNIIGKPIDNTQIYILNSVGLLQPIGVAGEIHVSGEGVARGYLNRTEFTEEKFIDNPFKMVQKMYKTGDLGAWTPDGNIEFLGRIDHQVKIRGFRIELGEIESQLLTNEAIKETIVMDRQDINGNKYLCAYIVSEKELMVGNLRKHLSNSLPQYMIPSHFVQLEKMPLTPNGKIDRKALPEPDGSITTGIEYEAPRNQVEERLVEVWKNVLAVERVGISDNFFELGGHSLKATTLVSKIHKELDVEMPLSEIFKFPTIKGISEYIEGTEKSIYSSIEIVEKKEYYEASSAQKRMYMLQQFDKDSIAYNMSAVFELQGKIDKERIEETFKKLSLRHEALRTCFETVEGEIVEKIDNSYEFELIDREDTEEIESIINKFVRPFELEKAPLFRVEIVESREKTYLLVDMHHIISDGISMDILMKEFTTIYKGESLEPLKLQYKDFAQWQNKFLKSEEIKKQEEYWVSRFSDEIPVLNLQLDYERPLMQSFEGEDVSFELDEEATEKLGKLAKETGTTMHMVLLAAFNILLSKYSGQEDIVVGTPIAGRSHADLQNIMGMFVNTLALRSKPTGDKKYLEFLKEVKENCIKAYENQSYQFETLVEKLDIRRDTSRNPLFDVMFNMIDGANNEDIRLNELILKQYNNKNKTSKIDLTLNVVEKDKTLKFSIDYCSKLFKKGTIERLSNHYIRVLDNITNNKEMKICEIELLTEKEKNQILYEFNDTKATYPREKTVQVIFEAQVEKTPNNIALVFKDEKLTYRELNEKANQFARVLRSKGVKADSIVGIMIERSPEMVIGIMGILKAGGAYLPMDPELPKDRIDYMIKDAEINILVTSKELTNTLEFNGIMLEVTDENILKENNSNLDLISKCNNLAYVIYTSGTTGKPKGVMIENRELINFIYSTVNAYNGDFGKNDNCLSLTNIVFDVSVCEIFLALTQGAKLILNNKHKTFDVNEIGRLIIENKVTFTYIPPLLLNEVHEVLRTSNEKTSLNKLLVGVEPIRDEVLEKYLSLNEKMQIVNAYGPTETTICSTMYKFIRKKEDIGNVSIGKPIQNTKIYIVDKNNKLQPIGIAGELCICGDGLSRGYLNDFTLTEEKFVLNPFEKGSKMYKTGDFARWSSDGNIQFIGRVDNQVKVRGFRVELGEIESQLLSYEEIEKTVVEAREDKNGTKYLCAYVVAHKELVVGDIRAHLSKKLPEYMIPAYFVQLASMPLNVSGKIDKKALPEPGLNIITGTEYEAPRNEIEEKLVVIWSEILGVEKIGINHNFFELGGHSLKAIQVISLIHKELNTKISLASFFKTPTIASLYEIIKGSQNCIHDEIKALPRQKYYDISYAQNRLWIINQLQPNSLAYNMPGYITLYEKIDINIIRKVFEKLIHRHDALRTRFEVVDDKVVQIIEDNVDLKIDTVDLSEVNNKEQYERRKRIFKVQASRIFNLGEAPLISINLVKIKEEEYDLIFCMHHIISDGWSIDILKKEFFLLYNALKEGREFNLQALTIQYRDYAAWQNELIKDTDKMRVVKEYWYSQLKEEISPLRLPVSHHNSELSNKNSAGYRIVIPENQKAALKALAIEYNTSLFVVLLSTFNFFLADLTGQKDIFIGTAGFGRNHEDFKNIIGYFVNTIIIRNQINYEESFIDLLKRINGNALKALEYQDFPIELITDELKIDYPKISVFFNMLNIGNSINEHIENFSAYHVEKVQDAKFDMVWYVTEYANGIEIMCDYLLDIFEPSRVEYIMARYMKLTEAILEKSNNVLKDYNIDNKKRKRLKGL